MWDRRKSNDNYLMQAPSIPVKTSPSYSEDNDNLTAPRTWMGRRCISARSNTEMEFINETDQHGNPAGGRVNGCGFHIYWQDGPVNREEGERANGAFIEDVLDAVIDRMTFYQEGKFACLDNAEALRSLIDARKCMDRRRHDRHDRGVLGKHLL